LRKSNETLNYKIFPAFKSILLFLFENGKGNSTKTYLYTLN